MWGAGLLNGLRISMRNMLRGPITVKYPYEKLELPERARWAVVPTYDEAGALKCTACMTCVKACPNHILDLDFTTDETTKQKHIDSFFYELGACMMCGLCVEQCPFDAIEMSHDYELARTSPAELSIELLADVDAARSKRERPAKAEAEGPPPTEAAEPAAEPAPGTAVAPDEGEATDA